MKKAPHIVVSEAGMMLAAMSVVCSFYVCSYLQHYYYYYTNSKLDDSLWSMYDDSDDKKTELSRTESHRLHIYHMNDNILRVFSSLP